MLQRLYNRILALAGSPYAFTWLATIAFAESSFFPIPPDALLVPMAIARPDRAFYYALICTVASVLGGMLGYFFGYALFDYVALPILQLYHYEAAFEEFRNRFAENGVYIILIKGLLPIPFKIVTIASGVSAMNFPAFVAACVVTRGGRFFLEALLIRQFGVSVQHFIERRLTLVTSVFAVCLVGGFLLLKYI
jgi:membrane protein YqaA with SNARE-associated domain